MSIYLPKTYSPKSSLQESSSQNTSLENWEPLEPATLVWEADGRPRSKRFDDVYYSGDRLGEVQRVFLQPSNLPARFAGSTDFTVAELGFGSGLNFVATADAWLRQGSGTLHFISADRHPLRHADLARCAATFTDPGIRAHYRELLANYPPLAPGWQRRWLYAGRIMLSLFWGDALSAYSDIVERQRRGVDAWFLDGFAPDRNPDMWQAPLWPLLARLSTRGATVATFSAAGAVRRGLGDVGFEMRRVDQRPHKRESLAGTYTCGSERERIGTGATPIVVGAGIAGASIAQHLARSGQPCRVFDSGRNAGTSHTLPAALVHTRLRATDDAPGRLRRNGYGYAQHLLAATSAFRGCGIVQAAQTAEEAQRLQRIATRVAEAGDNISWLDATAAGACGAHGALGGLFFEHGGVLQPATAIDELLRHPLIDVVHHQPLTEQALSNGNDGAPVILACGMNVRTFAIARYLEMTLIGGQLNLLRTQAPLTHALAGHYYQIPVGAGDARWVGTSYEHAPWAPRRALAHNTTQLASSENQNAAVSGQYRAYRCVSSDRWPIAGALGSNGGRAWFVSSAHGSLGMIGAQLGATVVTAHLTGVFAALTTAEEALLDPARFIARQARRGYRMGATAAARP